MVLLARLRQRGLRGVTSLAPATRVQQVDRPVQQRHRREPELRRRLRREFGRCGLLAVDDRAPGAHDFA
jgi:hypothetical protein